MNQRFPFLSGWIVCLAAVAILVCAPAVFSAQAADAAHDDFATRLSLARALSYTNKVEQLEQSADEYRVLVASRPGDLALRAEAADVLMRLQRYDDALREWDVVLAKQPGHRGAQLAVARIMLWTRRYDEAISRLLALRKQSPDSTEVLLELAHAYAWSRHHQQAIECYRELISKAPKPDPGLLVELGDVYLYDGRLEVAADVYARAVTAGAAGPVIRKKQGLILSWLKRDDEAIPLLQAAYSADPDDREPAIELVRIYLRGGRRDEAEEILQALAKKYPDSPDILMEMADSDLAEGHAEGAWSMYLHVLSISKDREAVEIRFADAMLGWGAFSGAERIYRKALEKNPASPELRLKLARVLVAAQRYEQAEGLYRQMLLERPGQRKVLLELAQVMRQEKRFSECFALAAKLLERDASDPDALLFEAIALSGLNRYDEAIVAYELLGGQSAHSAEALLGKGKLLLKLNRIALAQACFDQAYLKKPGQPEIVFRHLGLAAVTSAGFREGFLGDGARSPESLCDWAACYAANGRNDLAIECYREALDRDPKYFPARIALAETLGNDRQYQRALTVFRTLDAKFYGNTRIQIGMARVLSWSRDYRDSLELYDRMHAEDPSNPVPRREKARVAYWAKLYEESFDTFDILCRPRVDRQLAGALDKLAAKTGERWLREQVVRPIGGYDPESAPYVAYENFVGEWSTARARFPRETGRVADAMLVGLLPAYRIQKAAWLERRAKWLTWNLRFKSGLSAYKKLIAFSPGNEEAWFDLAQVQHILGLVPQANRTSRKLLDLDPLHSLAPLALKNGSIEMHPALEAGYRVFDQQGRGNLCQMTRQRFDVGVDVPLLSAVNFGITGHEWLERPRYNKQVYKAFGQTLALKGVLTESVRGAVKWTHKNYSDSGLDNTDTGLAQLRLNLNDIVQIEGGYSRADVLDNYFGLLQGVQADAWRLRAPLQFSRYVSAVAEARYLDYNDHNSAQHHLLSGAWAMTDHPRILKLIITGEYRDTRELSTETRDRDMLVKITHPYWTPQDYVAGSVAAEWRHDLSTHFFSAADKHWYDLKCILSYDTESNPSIELDGEWFYQFRHHLTAGLTAMITKSRKYDAESLTAKLQYRF